MCRPPNADYCKNDGGFIQYWTQRAQKQRRNDRKWEQEGADLKGRTADAPHRKHAVMCFAISVDSKNYYVGYSGSSSGMMTTHNKRYHSRMDTEQSNRRLKRLKWDEPGFDPLMSYRLDRRPLCNCAEASARSIAKAWGEDVSRLFFLSFKPAAVGGKGWTLMDPCQNCKKWVPVQAFGCWQDNKLVCRGGWDREDEDDQGPAAGSKRSREGTAIRV